MYGSFCLPPFDDPLLWPTKAKTGYAVFMVGEAEMMSTTDLSSRSSRLSLLNLVLCHSYVGCVLPSILNRPRGHYSTTSIVSYRKLRDLTLRMPDHIIALFDLLHFLLRCRLSIGRRRA